MALAGHLDTKPPGPLTEWRTICSTPTVAGDRIVGLGTSDMKGALAAMVHAAAIVLEMAPPRRGRFMLAFTSDEEYAMRGARRIAGTIASDAIVIGEPAGTRQDWERLYVASRGLVALRVSVEGTQMHSSLSDVVESVNASADLAWVLQQMHERFRIVAPDHPYSAQGITVNVGVTLSGGVQYGVYPGHAEFGVDIRVPPGIDAATIDQALEDFFHGLRSERPDVAVSWTKEPPPLDWMPATETPADSTRWFAPRVTRWRTCWERARPWGCSPAARKRSSSRPGTASRACRHWAPGSSACRRRRTNSSGHPPWSRPPGLRAHRRWPDAVTSAGASVLIRDVSVIDGTGSGPGPPESVIVIDGTITYVGPETDESRAWPGDVVDGRGRILMPGFIDLHVHATSLAEMRCYLANGVTTIRYAGIDAASIAGVRAGIDGALPGPRTLSCGPMIDMEPPSWPSWSRVVADGMDARVAAREMLAAEPLDALIVVHGASSDVVRAAVEVASDVGKPVVGQLWLQDAEEAAELGVRQLDNTSRIFASRGIGSDELARRRPLPERLAMFARAWTSVDQARTERLMDAMVRRSVAYCPTFVSARLHTGQTRADLERDGDFVTMFEPADVAQLDRFARETNGVGSSGAGLDWSAATEARMDWVRWFALKGGTVVAGTDTPFGGVSLPISSWRTSWTSASRLSRRSRPARETPLGSRDAATGWARSVPASAPTCS